MMATMAMRARGGGRTAHRRGVCAGGAARDDRIGPTTRDAEDSVAKRGAGGRGGGRVVLRLERTTGRGRCGRPSRDDERRDDGETGWIR